MQRWILLGMVALALVLAAGGVAAWKYREGRPTPMWVPLPLNPDLPEDRRKPLADELQQKLTRPDTLRAIVRDLRLEEEWELAGAEAAAAELRQRIFVEIGETMSPMGVRVPSVNIGVRGTRREQELTGRVAQRVMEEVKKLIESGG